MKNNKNKISINEQFIKDMSSIFWNHYHKALSKSIKRGLAKKRERVVHLGKVAM